MPPSEKKKASNARFDAKATKHFSLKLNINTDADILARLETVENIQGYIKELIRQDIKAQQEK